MDATGRPRPAARILAVDDEPDVLRSLGDVLDLIEGVEVDRATGLGEALRLLQERPYDLVIADERLADGSGTEFLRWVGHASPTTGRVLISAQVGFEALLHAVNDARIHLFVPKPWEPEELARRIHRLLLEQAVLHERLRGFARASAAGPVEAPAPSSPAGAWPPS